MKSLYRCSKPTAVFSIEGKFPGMNEYTKACRSNYMAGAAMKKEYQSIIEWSLKKELKGKAITTPIDVCFFFTEPNKRRDRDNIAGFFHKVFFDAMQAVGAIPNDGWDEVHTWEDTFEVDKNHPNITVVIYECVEVDT